MSKSVFLGFQYTEPYLQLYSNKVSAAAEKEGWSTTIPFRQAAVGMILERLGEMISESDRAIYEVGVENGNVWFEIGITLGRRQPVALMSGSESRALPDILRAPWLRPYETDDDCIASIVGYLNLASPPPLVSASQVVGDPARVVVIGRGSRAESIAVSLQDSGSNVVLLRAESIRSLNEAIALADSSGFVTVVRPESGEWAGHDAIAALVTLGAAWALHRPVALVAGVDEVVPSDCLQLTTRGNDGSELVATLQETFRNLFDSIPSGGTRPPRIDGALPRPLSITLAEELGVRGRILLLAEPGYGKTTVLGQVAKELGRPVAWLTIEPNWALDQLLEALVSSMGKLVPAFGWNTLATLRQASRTADSIVDRTLSRRIPSPEQLAELLVSESAVTHEPIHLVLDDFQRVTEDGARLVARLIEIAPEWLRLSIAGRDSPLPVRLLVANGSLPSWGADDLRFSAQETASYLRQAVTVNDAAVALLHQRTEGWPAALAVIRAWLLTHPDASLDTLQLMTRGDRQEIYRIFATDFFVGLPRTVQQTLLSIALPQHIDSEVALHLLGDGGGVELRNMVEGPYFLSEEKAGSFRMHSLFREFLAQRWIEERGRASLVAAKSSLANWYKDKNDSAVAYQMACEAEDWNLATIVLEPVIRTLANGGDAAFLRQLLQPLPMHVIRNNRPLWESWVSALIYSGAPEALDEARLLANSSVPDAADEAVAQLLLLQLLHDLGESSDEQLAAACDELAGRVEREQPQLALQARLVSLGARSAGSIDPTRWPTLRQDAVSLAEAAEAANLESVASVAWSTAADLGHRSLEMQLTSEATRLSVLQDWHQSPPLSARVEAATSFIAAFDQISKQFGRAFDLAHVAKEPIVLAQVRIQYSRFLTLAAANNTFRNRQLDHEMRVQAEHAIDQALAAAQAYDQFGMPRGVVIALNAAAQAAAVLDDQERLKSFTDQASLVAERHGYTDLQEAAVRIREQPTVLSLLEKAINPPPLHQRDPSSLQKLVDESLRIAGLSETDARSIRPSIERELLSLSNLDEQREQVCQYLELLMDLSRPRIGPFIVDPLWHVVCRMRGLTSLNEHRRSQTLLHQFTTGVCSNCEFRTPGPGEKKRGLDDLYTPMFRRLGLDSHM